MLDEIYTWMESYAGVSFDFDETMQDVGESVAIIEPFTWHAVVIIMLSHLDDACDIIDTYWRAIPEGLPSKNRMKRMITEHAFTLLIANIRNICNLLNLDIPEITSMEFLKKVIEALYDLLQMLTNNTIDDIISNHMYDDHEEANDDSFSSILSVMPEDMSQLAMTVTAIRDAYYDALDNEDLG